MLYIERLAKNLRYVWGLGFSWLILALCYLCVPPWTHIHPLNDSFTYIQPTLNLAATGTYHTDDLISATFVAQAYWGALFVKVFGDGMTSLTYSIIVAAFAAVAGLYVLVRVCGGSQIGATIASLTLAVNPLFVNLSYSFMTDIPFVALVIWASVCFVAAAKHSTTTRRTLILLVGGSVLVGAAYLVRQLGLFVPIGVLLMLWVRRRLGWQEALAVIGVPLGVWITYAVWFRIAGGSAVISDAKVSAGALGNWLLDHATLLPIYVFFRGMASLQYLGLMTLPIWVIRLFLYVSQSKRVHFTRPPLGQAIWIAVAGIYGIWAILAGAMPAPILMSLVSYGGGYGPGLSPGTDTGSGTGLSAPWPAELHQEGWVWFILALIALPVSIRLGIEFGRVGRFCVQTLRTRLHGDASDTHTAILLNITTLFVLLSGLTLIYSSFFDRYLLPMLPLLCVVLTPMVPQLSPTYRRLMVSGSLVTIAAFALFSFTHMRVYWAWNDARWDAAQKLLDQGIAADQIDGGYDWNGWYSGQLWSDKMYALGIFLGGHPWEYAWRTNHGDPPYLLAWENRDGYHIIASQRFDVPFSRDSAIIYTLKSDTYQPVSSSP